MNYKKRIDKVIDFIGRNLDEDLKLDDLCKIACFSKYHFHRLFTVHSGMSLKAYVKWLRLKRAAYQLSVNKQDSILTIALNAGFESHESFSRAFKKICGQSPSNFKSNPSWCAWRNDHHALKIKGEKIMEITVKNLPTKRLAVMEHRGDPMKLGITLDKLISWSKAQPIDLKPKPGKSFGLGYSDPRDTPPEDFRFDLALCIPEAYKLNDKVKEKNIPSGKYVIATHKGSRDNLGDTIYSLYRNWLPKAGEELGDFPCIFCYYNFDHEVAESELLTEVWLLLK